MRVRRFYPNHEYHPFPEGDSFVRGRKTMRGIRNRFWGMQHALALLARGEIRSPPTTTGDLHPGKSSKSRPRNYGRAEGKGGKGKEAEFMNRCMDQRRRGRKEEERGRRRHKKHKKDFIGPSTRPTESVCLSFSDWADAAGQCQTSPCSLASSLSRSELLTLLTRRLWETVECEEFQKSSAI